MAKTVKPKKTKTKKTAHPSPRPLHWIARHLGRLAALGLCLFLVIVVLLNFINPPTTYTMLQESRRLGGVKHEWVDLEDIAPVMLRSVVAAEDVNFCTHWGFDVRAIRAAIAQGGVRGASTISQQTVKNVFLWQGRSYIRKLLEALLTPITEALWPKRRILELYLNIAEFDEGVFGVKAAARHYFGVTPDRLSKVQAARLAAVLPSPKTRSASKPDRATRKRAAKILSGAAIIQTDQRSACFQS